jgi:tRNA dimethylallyltransferase
VKNARKSKIIIILGPTSSGKSEVAIMLAKRYDGEILSADSRQIYRGLDIGTGKITKREQKLAKHYLLDIISPRTNFSAARFKKRADKIIADILRRGKLPIICGGTGFWIKTIVDNVTYPEVKPDPVLRNQLSNNSAEELFKELKKLDPERARTIDAKNKVRLIRAIEICKTLGKVPPFIAKGSTLRISKVEPWQFLQIGISLSKEKLRTNIKKRLEKRLRAGMVEEVKRLHFKDKVSWKRLESFGLGYSLIPKYLRGEIKTKEELFEKIYQAEKNYAKRQMTWFRKDKRIIWRENYREIKKEVKKFMS